MSATKLKLKVVPMKRIYPQAELMNRLQELTASKWSVFSTWLRTKRDGRAILAYQGEYLVAWALLKRESDIYSRGDGYLFGVYVDPAFRRKGIATKLAQRAREIAERYNKPIGGQGWNFSSNKFFSSVNFPRDYYWNCW